MPTLNAAYNSLDPTFKPIVLEILTRLEKKGWQPIVAEGRRTVEQQKEKVRLGYSKTMKSYHLTGKAADIVDKRFLWNKGVYHEFWLDLGAIVMELREKNPKIRWGGVWDRPFSVYQHLQKTKGRPGYFIDVAHVELR